MKLLSSAAALCAIIPVVAWAAPDPAECRARDNGTQVRLTACIQRDPLWQHMKDFQRIADANPLPLGHANRDTGTRGYRQSVLYVASLMRDAGYDVTIQRYPLREFTVTSSRLAVDGADWQEGRFPVARMSGAGHAAGRVTAAGEGCSAHDYAGFPRGGIALLLRGASCPADEAVSRAAQAGAAAVLFYNTAGHDGAPAKGVRNDGAAFPLLLEDPAPIPVLGNLSQHDGAALAGRNAEVAVQAGTDAIIDYNVIADSPYGDPHRVVVVDAHLDSIHGAGILDNASGSSTIIEIARNLAKTQTRNKLRYVWFGGEELGLYGSRWYTRHLDAGALADIAFDIDVDVTATPNFAVLVADPANAYNKKLFPANVIPQSQFGNDVMTKAFASEGVTALPAHFGNAGTDSNSFARAGVPNTGILTQQDCCKPYWQVRIWGGFIGDYDGQIPGDSGGCVDQPHRWCDDLPNADPFVLEFASRATAAAVLKIANSALPAR